MMILPAIPFDRSSKRQPVAGVVIDLADDGRPRATAHHPTPTYNFSIEWGLLSSGDAAALRAFFAAAAGQLVTMTWSDGAAYTVLIESWDVDAASIPGWSRAAMRAVGQAA